MWSASPRALPLTLDPLTLGFFHPWLLACGCQGLSQALWDWLRPLAVWPDCWPPSPPRAAALGSGLFPPGAAGASRHRRRSGPPRRCGSIPARSRPGHRISSRRFGPALRPRLRQFSGQRRPLEAQRQLRAAGRLPPGLVRQALGCGEQQWHHGVAAAAASGFKVMPCSLVVSPSPLPAPACSAGMPTSPMATPGAFAAACLQPSPTPSTYPDSGRVAQLLRGGSCNNNPTTCRSAQRNHNQPDTANTTVGFRVVCLPQHPSPSEPLEGIPPREREGSKTQGSTTQGSTTQGSTTQGSQTRGSRPAPVSSDHGPPGLPPVGRRLIRTAPGGAPIAHGPAIGAGSAPFFSPAP